MPHTQQQAWKKIENLEIGAYFFDIQPSGFGAWYQPVLDNFFNVWNLDTFVLILDTLFELKPNTQKFRFQVFTVLWLPYKS